MATEPLDLSVLQDKIDEISAKITKQGAVVRTLKKEDSSNTEGIAAAVQILTSFKKEQKELLEEKEAMQTGEKFDRDTFNDLVLRKMFVVPSFEIHGGVKGLYDLGPPACSLKAAMIDTWRKHFVLNESMLEMECTCLTPEPVLKTSGHVDRFTDLMVKDEETKECARADKLLEDAIDDLIEANPTMPTEEKEEHLRIQRQADAYTPAEIDDLLLKYDVKAASGEPYSNAFPFNLMFKTHIGPEGTSVGYLRPETAQGLFVNFKRLLDYNAQKMPFAAAQIGLGFRNEIAPRAGLLRVREFCMGEIEHFVNPNDKSHVRFGTVTDKELILFGRDDQLGSGKTITMSIGEAVKTGLVNNETLGYFMARTQLYMERIGMDPARLRFRQHLATEMAHYASDCWDLEIECSYGWTECVGHADRACYDLQVHSEATKTPMLATVRLDTPKDVEIAKLKFNGKVLGKAFRQDQRKVRQVLEALAEDWTTFGPVADALEAEGKATVDGFEITSEMVTWTKASKKIHEEKFTPSVIEPSFGMGRILYSLLEHCFYKRENDEQRCVMKFNPQVAPNKCAVLPLSSDAKMNAAVDKIAASLTENDLSTRVDKSTASLGRRYARCDEVGVPFAVTCDFETLENDTVTLRERDSTVQVRVPVADVTKIIFDFVHSRVTWDEIMKKYPVVTVSEDENEAATKPVTAEKTVVVGKFRRPA